MKENLKKKFKNFFLKNKKIIIFICILSVLGTIGIAFGRYIYDGVQNFYFATKKFYFDSDKLAQTMANYQLDNWSGVDDYTININMNSIKNNLVKADTDITYNITFSCSSTIICQTTQNSGTIWASTNSDSFNIVVTPNATFKDGDTVVVFVSATSTSPYKKTISGRFVLKVGKIGLSYEIDDSANSPYLEMRITNTIDYYSVRTAFTSTSGRSYTVGERIDITSYLNLTATEQANCASVIITLNFDPNITLLDMTNPSYLRKLTESSTTINNYQYINSYSFKIDAISSEIVKFYKINPSIDYTYPIVNTTSIISFSYE